MGNNDLNETENILIKVDSNNLIYIDDTQEDGLWRTGNQDRNDPNLQSLIKKYLI